MISSKRQQSPTWEGPYRVSQCVPSNAYILEMLEGERFSRGEQEIFEEVLPEHRGRCLKSIRPGSDILRKKIPIIMGIIFLR